MLRHILIFLFIILIIIITVILIYILQHLMMEESLPDTPANKSLNKRTIRVHTKVLIQTCDIGMKN